jgi:hypothetical protein
MRWLRPAPACSAPQLPHLPAAAAARLPARQERAKAFSSYRDYLGKDITSLVILPVWIMQPFTMLQVGAAAAAEATGACPPSLRCAA